MRRRRREIGVVDGRPSDTVWHWGVRVGVYRKKVAHKHTGTALSLSARDTIMSPSANSTKTEQNKTTAYKTTT